MPALSRFGAGKRLLLRALTPGNLARKGLGRKYLACKRRRPKHIQVVDFAKQILHRLQVVAPGLVLLGQEILHDVAQTFDADAQGVKRNLGAVAKGAVVEIAGGGPTLEGEVLEHSAAGADVRCALRQRAAPLAPLLAVEFSEGDAGFALLLGFAAG